MKTHIRNLFRLIVLITDVLLMLAAPVTAQTFTVLHSFTGGSDGGNPYAGLLLSGNTLYGTSSGTVFAINTDGTGFTTLHKFTAISPADDPYDHFWTNSDGAFPHAGLILSGNTLYGTTFGGGSGWGTVFSIMLPAVSMPQPKLTIVNLSGTNVVLTWPTNFTGYHLQSTTALASSAIWTSNSPAPVVVNGQYTVTNPISGTKQFFRLSQ